MVLAGLGRNLQIPQQKPYLRTLGSGIQSRSFFQYEAKLRDEDLAPYPLLVGLGHNHDPGGFSRYPDNGLLLKYLPIQWDGLT